MEFIKSIIKGDKVIWTIYGLLIIVSILEVYSATSTLTHSLHEYWQPFARHFLFLMASVGIVIIVHFIPPKYFKKAPMYLIPTAFILLIMTYVCGVEENDATRWFSFFGVKFQPSELAKLAVIITMSLSLSKMRDTEESINMTFKFLLILTFVFCGLIVPENFSTAGLLGCVCFLMMFIGRIPLLKLIKVGGVLVALIVTMFIFAPHIPEDTPLLGRLQTWHSRIMTHSGEITKENVFDRKNYQSSHAKIAIARGGIFGKGPGNSQERDFLPQAYSDFIYAIIIEELGLVSGAFVLLLYLILMFRAGVLARRCKRSFYAFLMMGAAMIVVIQALINMSVAVSLIPVTGQTLPLISRGGTSILITSLYFGIMLSISRTTMENEDKDDIDKEILPSGVKLVNENS